MTQAIRDQNHVTVALGQSNADSTLTLPFLIDSITGRLLVDATGGGGSSGYQAPLSGGLTGTNTWTTSPNVIVVDNVPRQRVQTDGTVNWTVSGSGPYTTVLAVAPNYDVYAL